MIQKHLEFLQEQKQNVVGQEWFRFLQEFISELYNSKGVALQDIPARQKAAEHLEKLLIADNKPEPRKNDYI